MKLRNVLLTALSFVLVATLAVGGTVAYLTSEDSDVNVMTLGNVEIAQHEYERVVENDAWVSVGKTDKYGYAPDKVQEYTQAKPLLPAVFADGEIKWDDRNGSQNASGDGSHQQSWAEVGAPGSNQLFDDSVKNVQDKFVFVENTGKTDAYVRTWFAFEQGDVAKENFDKIIMTNTNVDHWSWSDWTYDVEIDGNTYVVVSAVYNGPKSNPTGILAAGATSYASLLQVYMRPEATNEDVEAIDGNDNGTYDILVFSQAVQTAGFVNAEAALTEGFGNAHPWTGKVIIPVFATGVEQVENVLTTGGELYLEKDIAADAFEVAADAEVKVDLDGQTISTANGFVNNGVAEIEDGKLENSSTGYGARTTLGATTTYTDVIVNTMGGGVNVWGTAVWNDGSITTDSTSTSARHVFYVAGGDEADGHLTINGGEFTFSPKNLTRKGSYICAQGEGATVIVNGGTFHKPSTRTAPIQALDGATVVIYGGTFQFDPSAFVADGYEAVKGADGYWTVSAKNQ